MRAHSSVAERFVDIEKARSSILRGRMVKFNKGPIV